MKREAVAFFMGVVVALALSAWWYIDSSIDVSDASTARDSLEVKLDRMQREVKLAQVSILHSQRVQQILRDSSEYYKKNWKVASTETARLTKLYNIAANHIKNYVEPQVDSALMARYESYKNKVDLMPLPAATGSDIVNDLNELDKGRDLIHSQNNELEVVDMYISNQESLMKELTHSDSIRQVIEKNLNYQNSKRDSLNEQLTTELADTQKKLKRTRKIATGSIVLNILQAIANFTK